MEKNNNIDPKYKESIEQIRLDSEEYADSQMSDVYNVQNDKLDEVHKLIGLIYIKYAVDGLLEVNNQQKKAILSDISSKLQSIIKELGQVEVDKVTNILGDTYKDTYYKNAYVMDSGMDVDLKFNILKQQFIDEAVNKEFKGELFSDRIWKNKDAMMEKLKKSLIDAMQGDTTIDKIGKDIKDTFGVQAFESRRLVRTETARLSVDAQEQIGLDSGVKEVMWSSTLDMRTAPKDASFDGQTWGIDEDHPKPVYSTHPNCRCVLINVPFANWKPTKRKDNETKGIIDYKDYATWLKDKGINN